MADRFEFRSAYTSGVEREKSSMIDSYLQQCSPLIAFAGEGQLVFVGSPQRPGERTRQVVHPRGLIFGGIGEIQTVNFVAKDLILQAHQVELLSGQGAVRAERVLEHSEQAGALALIRTAFFDSLTRPFVGDFCLGECSSRSSRLFYFSASGRREVSDSFIVLADDERHKALKEGLEGIWPEWNESLAVPMSNSAGQTIVRVVELWKASAKKQAAEVLSVRILASDNQEAPRLVFEQERR